ncbi:MAG: hypothetical protein ACFFCD_04325 [Promethearchaeota archaeon]
MREIKQETLFDLRWLTKRYYTKKGFIAHDISHWQHYNRSSIKRGLRKNVLFLKDSKDNLYGIVIIRDWKRVIGVNQGYQVEKLKDLLKKKDIEINNLKFILVSKMGFSESIEAFADKHKIELKSERDMSYEYPTLGEFMRKMKKSKDNVRENEKKLEVATLPEDDFKDIQIPHPKDAKEVL